MAKSGCGLPRMCASARGIVGRFENNINTKRLMRLRQAWNNVNMHNEAAYRPLFFMQFQDLVSLKDFCSGFLFSLFCVGPAHPTEVWEQRQQIVKCFVCFELIWKTMRTPPFVFLRFACLFTMALLANHRRQPCECMATVQPTQHLCGSYSFRSPAQHSHNNFEHTAVHGKS